jgi:hypothetical protein
MIPSSARGPLALKHSALPASPRLRQPVAKTLVNKGGTLGALGRSDEAIAVCDDVVNTVARRRWSKKASPATTCQ